MPQYIIPMELCSVRRAYKCRNGMLNASESEKERANGMESSQRKWIKTKSSDKAFDCNFVRRVRQCVRVLPAPLCHSKQKRVSLEQQQAATHVAVVCREERADTQKRATRGIQLCDNDDKRLPYAIRKIAKLKANCIQCEGTSVCGAVGSMCATMRQTTEGIGYENGTSNCVRITVNARNF